MRHGGGAEAPEGEEGGFVGREGGGGGEDVELGGGVGVGGGGERRGWERC